VQQHADAPWDPPALQGVDARSNRGRDDDREEEERNHEPPGPDRCHDRQNREDDKRGYRNTCRERTKRDGSAVLLDRLVGWNPILHWHRHGPALTTRGARATARNWGRCSVTGDGLIGVGTLRLEEPNQDVDENREEDRHREGEQETARRAAVDANATAGQRLRAKPIMRFHRTDSPARPTCKRRVASAGWFLWLAHPSLTAG
jgi:hypothetical protein